MATPLINGQAYSYADASFAVNSVLVYGVVSLKWTVEQPKTNEYASGYFPTSRGRGVKNASGTIELEMQDVVALRDSARDGDLTNLPAFDIVASYDNGTRVVTEIIKNVEFTADQGGGGQGDTRLVMSFDFIASHVKHS